MNIARFLIHQPIRMASFIMLLCLVYPLQAQTLSSLTQEIRENLALGHYRQANNQLLQLEKHAIEQQYPYASTLAKGLQGYIALRQQNLVLAEELLTAAFTQAQQNAWSDLTIRFAVYLGELNENQQNLTRAKLYFVQAESLALQETDKSFLISSLINQAKLSMSENQVSTAQQQLQQARTLLQNLPLCETSGQLWLSLGYQTKQLAQLSKQSELIAQSFEALTQALTYARDRKQLRLQATSLKYLASLYQQQQRNSDAIKLLQEGIEIAKKEDANDLLLDLQWSLGELYKSENKPQLAIAAYREALKHLENMRLDIPVSYEQGRSSFRDTFAPIYLGLADLLLKQTLVVKPSEQKPLLQEARNAIELMKKSEMEDYFKSRCEIPVTPIDLQKIDPHAAEIYPIPLPDRLEIIVETAKGLYHFTQAVPAKNLEELAREFASDLRNEENDNEMLKIQGGIFYHYLIKPIKAVLKQQHIETLVYIPDSFLRLVPLAALYDGKKFLIEDYAIATSVGASLMERDQTAHKNQTILLAGMSKPGDVVMDFPKPLLSSLIESVSEPDSNSRRLSRDLKWKMKQDEKESKTQKQDFINEKAIEKLKTALALPGVEAEIKQLGSQNQVPYLLNEDFSLENFIQTAQSQPYKILHIASHGFFGPTAEESFVMAHDKILNMNKLEAFLNSEHFRKNPLDLITFSACQTAEGDDRSPLGISGVAIKSKVHSALGSLWPVSDAGTAQLMATFYQALKTPGVSKAKALQQAEIKLLKQKDFENPRFWSPFILVGDWL